MKTEDSLLVRQARALQDPDEHRGSPARPISITILLRPSSPAGTIMFLRDEGDKAIPTTPSKVDPQHVSTEVLAALKAEVEFGREICGVLEIAEQREWLVTNGIGGFASGTVSGNLTRRYHGFLVAALPPPVSG